MLQVGDKVYCWDFSMDNHELCEVSAEPIIGTVEEVEGDRNEIVLLSMMNGKFYRRRSENVFRIGTGPSMKKPFTSPY